MINEELILNLIEDTDKILYTFEKDGKFAMSSSILNELFQEANASLKKVKEALAQPAQEPCTHRIADARNQYVKSGYFCLDCGMLFSAADHFDPPTAQPTQEPDCPKCGNNRQVWSNQITGLKTCHRVNCHTVIQEQEPV